MYLYTGVQKAPGGDADFIRVYQCTIEGAKLEHRIGVLLQVAGGDLRFVNVLENRG